MKAIEKYVGIDVNLEESLFEYGLLVEDTTEAHKWIIVRLKEDLFVKTNFDFSYIPELLKESYIIDNLSVFFSFSGLTEKEFMKSSRKTNYMI